MKLYPILKVVLGRQIEYEDIKTKDNKGRVPKKLGTLDIFSIATGAMISSGLFVLPAVVFGKVGPASILAYLLASLCVVPSLFAKAELSSAMPKSGGTYFFITRSFGPLIGIFSGMAAWFSLSLKSAFALLGIGIFLQPFIPSCSPNLIKLIAIGCTALFTVLNLISVKVTGQAGFLLLSFAAMLSFITTGNAGILAASRTPMAMARDRLLPGFLGKVSERFQTPFFSI